jgi:hypothetical protein
MTKSLPLCAVCTAARESSWAGVAGRSTIGARTCEVPGIRRQRLTVI